ncbi:MAG: glycosyltransferase [Leptolyngbya sp. Prado105]|nr:glycosyltransferase [Leptolyngbya sp. Prado105]
MGHTNQLIALSEELVRRGYTVSFVIHPTAKTWVNHPNIQVIPWEFQSIDDEYIAEKNTFWDNISQEPHSWRSNQLMLERTITFYRPMYESLKRLLQEHHPNCLIIDRAVVPAIDLATQQQLPFIIQSRFLGQFVKPSSDQPQFGTDYPTQMKGWQKVLNSLMPRLEKGYLLPTLLKLNRMRQDCAQQQHLPNPWENQTMIVGSSFDIEPQRSLPAKVHMVGPIFSTQHKPIEGLLHDWLESDKTGVIYMAFGTLATLSTWQAKELIEGLVQTGLKVLWALPEKAQAILPSLPSTVRVESFVSQSAVLSHPNIAAFVSHCGMNSIHESLYSGKPILALPLFGDQHYNAARLIDLGVALKLSKRRFSRIDVSSKMNQLLHNPCYQKKAVDISMRLKQTDGLNQAAQIVEIMIQTT